MTEQDDVDPEDPRPESHLPVQGQRMAQLTMNSPRQFRLSHEI